MSSENVYRSPYFAVDVIIEIDSEHIVLIERANPPYGWALPGGYVDFGEDLVAAVIREAKEETALDIYPREQFYTYSFPCRGETHTVSTVFIAAAKGVPVGGDDAECAKIFHLSNLPVIIADHQSILADYLQWKKFGLRPILGGLRREEVEEKVAA